MPDLSTKTVAVLATNGFEQSELAEPVEAMREAGVTVHIVAPEAGSIKGWQHDHWGDKFPVDRTIEQAQGRVDEYDALVLPGGVMNPDKLRTSQDAVRFVRSFFRAGKPVAAICHGPQILIDAEVVEGRTLTSYASVRKDLENAGANWKDREVVVDGNLITSRKPDDIPAFNEKLLEVLSQGAPAASRSA